MDPLSQGVVGVVAAQQTADRKHLLIASLLGFFAGMSADLDIFIKSSQDPLFSLEFHRQFTHSIFFMPFGGLICALFFYNLFLKNKDISFKQTYIYSTLGYATHGLLDACTTYGTQLFWPFTNDRIAWNTISIIDPLFTLPILFLVVFSVYKNSKKYSYIALSWIIIYTSLGFIQNYRAEEIGRELAESRGHKIINIEAKPSFANIIVWKTIYTTQTHYHIDAARVGFNTRIIEGVKIEKFDIKKSFPWLDLESQQAKDIERFRWFSNGYIATSSINPNQIIDIRYSMLPNEGHGLWGIQLNPEAEKDAYIKRISNRRSDMSTYIKLWKMIVD
ncbi:MAG: metal-dependent hydrolase [Gammaproteobacteria bacterium]|nr:metal-dependent hydrolase [Gammaproteobacteria bacterium]MBT6331989.1 metal-dependent hydrolase [Gammaproteobacteria bacterium]MDG2159705.1 metal-dependent hydrolase [Gammaproteobacteria bacterium]